MKKETEKASLVSFKETCYSITKTIMSAEVGGLVLKTGLGSAFTTAHVIAAGVVLILALFFLLLGLLAEE